MAFDKLRLSGRGSEKLASITFAFYPRRAKPSLSTVVNCQPNTIAMFAVTGGRKEKKLKYVAFYPSRPYWAVSKIDLEAPDIREHFREQMSEVVFSGSNHGHTIIVSRDGRISLNIAGILQEENGQVDALVDSWGTYLDHLNALFLFLDCAVSKVQNLAYFNLHEVTNRDAFSASDGEQSSESVASESIAGSFQMARSYDWHPIHTLPIAYQPMFLGRRLVTAGAISEMADTYFKVVAAHGAIKAYAGIARAVSAYKITNYETSLVFSWFLIEELLNMQWDDYLKKKSKESNGKFQRINKGRRDLLNGRDYTASVRSNILELAGCLEFELFSDINTIRKRRNQIVHQQRGVTVDCEDTQLAIFTALKMAEQRWAVSISPPMGFSISGL